MALTDVLSGSNPFRPGLLTGSNAIVTGGGSGLGRGIALGLALAGARVAVAGRRPERVAEVAAEIRGLGGHGVALTCDVRDHEAVVALVERASAELGPLDLLVNNAGATFTAATETLSPNGFRAVVETDAFGTFYLCQEVGRRLLEQRRGGAILNVTSTSPVTGNPGRLPGGVGKAGVESLTKSLAVEWGGHGIRSNSIAPGYTPTAGVDRATGADDGSAAERAAEVPLGRVGRVVDIVWPAVFLLSPAASFVNGAQFVVDGGRLLSGGRSFDPAAVRPAGG